MRRRKRTIEIFSLSALDLFASALGAFVIVTAILIPYYPNMKEGGSALANLQKALSENIEAEALAEQELKQTSQEIAAKEAEAEKAARTLTRKQALEETARRRTAANESLERELASLQQQLDSLPEPPEPQAPAPSALVSDFSILGITTEAKKIVIAVDLSGSIAESGASRTLIETLLEVIDPFHDGIQFAILGFQGFGVTQYWPVRDRMAVADARSKADARRFIAQIPAVLRGKTPTRTALLRALQYKPDAIILISDGEPTDAEGEDIVKRITELNRERVEINTVAIGKYLENNQLIQFLNELAKNNRGQFVGVISE